MDAIRVDERKEERPQCPYCHDALALDAPAWACPACGTRHHQGCASEHRRCTVLGCAAPVVDAKPVAEPRTPAAVAAAGARLERVENALGYASCGTIVVGFVTLFPVVWIEAEIAPVGPDVEKAAGLGGAGLFVLLLGLLGAKVVVRYLRLSDHDRAVKALTVFLYLVTMLCAIMATLLGARVAVGAAGRVDVVLLPFFLGLTLLVGWLVISQTDSISQSPR